MHHIGGNFDPQILPRLPGALQYAQVPEVEYGEGAEGDYPHCVALGIQSISNLEIAAGVQSLNQTVNRCIQDPLHKSRISTLAPATSSLVIGSTKARWIPPVD